ncbi:Ig-like domain repeat protein [Methanosphaera sp. WGK6]|uniref:beta strand repeat-containing protein n=1 Tax=Methanosphaera sp. WGK6 TaxID=1561964 RepID=UPI00086B4F24|nr:Ig-like domain repeat protein [Methanosphaera sp. WGK6]OED29695.1 hypothetical protein NL43_06830 [Methanosphaera sp. WGK6]
MFRNKTKLFLMVFLILMTIVGLSTLSAVDTNDTQNSGESSDSLVISNNVDNKIAEITTESSIKTTNNKSIKKESEIGTFTDLTTVIESSDNIILDKDYVKGESETVIELNKSLTINGNGHTITSDNGTFTSISTANITLQNIIFTGNDGKNPVITSNGNITLINVIFNNNKNTGYAAAALETTSNVTIINSTASNNTAIYGVFYFKSGSNVTVDNSNFTNCNTSNGVISAARNTNISVTNSRFLNNYAANYGGAINIQRYLYVNNSYFENNSAGIKGGAIALRGNYAEINNSKFISNYLVGERSTIQGGAIYVDQVALLTNNTMKDNKGYNGSTIFVQNGAKIAKVLVNGTNTSAIEDEEFTIVVTVTDDCNNSITGRNVTIKIGETQYTSQVIEGSAEFVITDSIEPGNYTISPIYNGAEEENQTVSSFNLEITPSPALKYRTLQALIDEAEEGSTITFTDILKRGSSEDNVTINKTITIDAKGYRINANEGHIFYITNNANVTLKNTVITNTHGREGIIANVTSGSLTLENVVILNNTAENYGAAYRGNLLYVEREGTMYLNNVTIENNTAAVIRTRGNTTLNNTIVRLNKVPQDSNSYGWINNEGGLNIYNSLFEDNLGQLSGIYSRLQVYPSIIDNSTFLRNNVSVGNGGAIQTGTNTTTITNSQFIENQVLLKGTFARKGGAIYAYGDGLTVINSTFINNVAEGGGSAIANYWGGFNVTNSILISSGSTSILYNEDEEDHQVIANNNWWGTNENPITKGYTAYGRYYDYDEEEYVECSPIVVTKWIIMNTTVTPSENFKYGDTLTIDTSFNQTMDVNGVIADYNDILPNGMNVTYTSNKNCFENNMTSVINGKTSNKYTIGSQKVVINTTSGAQTNTFEGTAIMPEPKVIILTDDTYSQFFDSEGRVILDMVPPNSELQFSGAFYNRNMVIDNSLNLTTHTVQAILNNCTITIIADGAYTNITNMIMNNTDYSTELIYLNNTNNIIIRNNTLIQNNTKDNTYAINLLSSTDITIESNNITTTGPCDDIFFDDDYIGYVVTASIMGYNSSDNIIKNNNIITNYTGDTSTYGTVESIVFMGNPMNFDEDIVADNNEITNNVIITEGKYAYGISLSGNVNDNKVTNNNLTSIGTHYANGIQLSGPASDNIISYNNINSTADNVTYGLYISTNMMGAVTDNTITYNNITANSSSIYLIEIWGISSNNISYNQLTGNNNYVLGIGGYNSNKNTITYNNITVTGDMQNKPISQDNIQVETSGVKLIGKSNDNLIQYNNISATTPNNITNTINLTGSSGNTVTNNELNTNMRNGSKSVDEQTNNNVKDNTPSNSITITLETTNDNNIQVIVKDINDNNVIRGTIEYTIGDETKTITLVDGVATIDLSDNHGIITVNVVYPENTVYNTGNATTTVTKKIKTTITLDNLDKFLSGETSMINAIVVDAEGNNVTTGNVTFTDEEGNVLGTIVLNNGVASINPFETSKISEITAKYNGNDIYEESSITSSINVKYTTNITIKDINAKINDIINLTANIDAYNVVVNEGKVIFKINGKTLRNSEGNIIYANVVNGVATIEDVKVEYNWLNKNTIVSAVYSGSSNFMNVRSSEKLMNITKRVATLEIVNDMSVYVAGQTISLSVKVMDMNSIVTGGKVVFKLNGKSLRDENGNIIYGEVNDEGVATITYTLPAKMSAKNYVVSCVYADKLYNRAEVKGTLTIKK